VNRVFLVPACFGLLAGAAAAQAPEPAPSAASVPAKSAERPALNLKLEEPARSEPRVTFGPREGTTEQRPVDALLPSLGGNPSTAYERPAKGSAPASPYPKDVTPGR
jgi:hypothetical protein